MVKFLAGIFISISLLGDCFAGEIPKNCRQSFKVNEIWKSKDLSSCEAACAAAQDMGLGNFNCPFGTMCETFCRSESDCNGEMVKDDRWKKEENDCVNSCIVSQKQITVRVSCDWPKLCESFCGTRRPASTDEVSLKELCGKFLNGLSEAIKGAAALSNAYAVCGKHKDTSSLASLRKCVETMRIGKSEARDALEDLPSVAYTDANRAIIVMNNQENPVLRESTMIHERVHLDDVRRWMTDHSVTPMDWSNPKWKGYERYWRDPAVITKTEIKAYDTQKKFLESETQRLIKKCKDAKLHR